MSKQKNISAYHIAAAYTGTVVGAGFASGQEIMQFFAAYGLAGFRGILLASLLFMLYGYLLLNLGSFYNARSHQTVIKYILSGKTSPLIDFTITGFLFITLTAMIAGAGAVGKEYLNLPYSLGSFVMALMVLGTVYLGVNFIIRALAAVVPFLVTGIFAITILAIFDSKTQPLPGLQQIPFPDLHPPLPGWGLSALVYTSYNLIIALGVLIPLGNRVTEKKTMKLGSLLGSIFLGAGAAAVMLTLILNFPRAAEYEIPMLYAVSHYSPLVHILYTMILFTEIYSTAVGNLFGLSARLTSLITLGHNKVITILTLAALLLSSLGFSRLVHYFYPVAGLAGIVLLLALTRYLAKILQEKII